MSDKVYRIRFAGGRGNSNTADMPADPPMLAMDEALAQINGLPGVLKPLEATDLAGVRGAFLVNDLPFKDGGRRIKTSGVQQIARHDLLRGVPFIFNHETYGTMALAVGRGFNHVTATAPSGAFWCGPRYYVLSSHPVFDTVALVESIDGGMFPETSIGMYARSFTCSICDEDAGDCDHAPRATYDGKVCRFEYDDIDEVDEFSVVLSGAIDGTRHFLAASDRREEREGVIDADAIEERAIEKALKREPSLFEQIAEAEMKRQRTVYDGLRMFSGGVKPAA